LTFLNLENVLTAGCSCFSLAFA